MRSSDQQLRIGDQRRRLLRHHMPLALGSAVVLVLFMTLPTFDPAGHTVDISSAPFPQQRGEGGSMGDSADEAGPTDAEESLDRTGSRSFVQRFTVATGYLATGLLALTLLIGPANLLLRRRSPISSYLRRDVGPGRPPSASST